MGRDYGTMTMRIRTALLTLLLGCSIGVFAKQAIGADDNWRNLSPREKERVQRNYQRWQSLPPQDKEHLREEWNRYRSLPKEQQERIKQRYNDQRRNRPAD